MDHIGNHRLPTSFGYNSEGVFHLIYNGESGGGQNTVTTAIPFVLMSSFSDVSLRTGIRYRNAELAVFIENLMNEKVLKLQTAGIPYANRHNEPRTIGVNLNYHW